MEIATLVPADAVVATNQQQTGTLLSCSKSEHQWAGRTTLTLAPGTDIEGLVRSISGHFEKGNDLTPEEYKDMSGDLLVQLIGGDRKENYIVGGNGKPDEFEISSFSKCFELPPDVYPGGDF